MKKKTRHKKDKISADLHAILGRLFATSDDYVIAVASWITYKRDGSSRQIVEAMRKALQHQNDVRLLYAHLDPKHYNEEI